jgi:hypothetical protein
MDPELLQLFASARGANKNVSGLLGNIDNPLLAFLAGVYDPVSAQGQATAGPLWAKYSQNPDPTIQGILQEIIDGGDPFSLSSRIDQMDTMGDISGAGFQVGDLKGLAKALHTEYTTAGDPKNMSVWAKAGLREPTDLYSTQDVPLGETSRKEIVGMREGQVAADRKLSTAQTKYSKSKSKLNLQDDLKEDLAFGIKSGTGGNDPRALLADWLKTQDYLDEDSLQAEANRLRPKERYRSIPFDRVVETAKGTLKKRGPKNNKAQQAEYTQAQYDVGSASVQSDAAKAAERLYREGLVSSYEAAGKTPTRDQLAGIMSFLSKSK